MKDRLKELRKSLNMTQQEFADRVSSKQSSIAQYEIGRSAPPDPLVTLICREFHVNEVWLREGIGEMFMDKSDQAEVERFLMGILTGEEGFKRRLVSALARMSPDEWDLLERKIKEISG